MDQFVDPQDLMRLPVDEWSPMPSSSGSSVAVTPSSSTDDDDFDSGGAATCSGLDHTSLEFLSIQDDLNFDDMLWDSPIASQASAIGAPESFDFAALAISGQHAVLHNLEGFGFDHSSVVNDVAINATLPTDNSSDLL